MFLTMKELLFMSIIGGGAISVLILSEVLRRRTSLNKEMTRKFVHLFAGIVALPMPYVFESHWPVLILTGSFFVIVTVTARINLLKSVHGVERKSSGAYLYPLSIYLLFLFAGDKPLFFILPLLVLLFSDSLAAVIGKTYGLIHYRVGEGHRSLEGSLVFFIVTLILIHTIILLSGITGRMESLLVALILAILITVFEAISSGGWDNFFIPFSTFFLLEHLIHLNQSEILFIISFIIVLAGICALPYTTRQFTVTGSLEIFLVGMMFVILGGINWIIPILGLYLMYQLPAIGSSESKQIVMDPQVPRHRGNRILSFSLPIVAAVFMYSYTGDQYWYMAYIVGIATQFVLLWNGHYDVTRGLLISERTDINFQHFINGTAGAILPLLYLYFFRNPDQPPVQYIVMGGIAFSAFFFQRLYTRKVQFVCRCEDCGYLVDNSNDHCGKSTTYMRGFEGMSHDRGLLIIISFSMLVWLAYYQFGYNELINRVVG